MKTFKLFLSTLFCATSIFAQETDNIRNGYKEDLRIYQEILEKSHSGLYLYTSKPTFDSIFDKANKIVDNENLTERDFYLLIAKIQTKIRCGHSSTSPGENVFASIDTSKIIFLPFQVKFIKDTLILIKDFRKIPKGSRVVGINGKSVDEIKKDAFEILTTDGYNQTFKHRQLEEAFFYYHYLLYGQSDEISIQYIPYKGSSVEELSFNRLEKDEFEFTEEEEIEMYYLSFIDDKTALLTVNSFYTQTKINQLKFFLFLKKSFKEINKKGIENLIVDVRENTGGDDGNDMRLASYLINGDFTENKFRRLNNINLPIYTELLTDSWKEMIGVKSKSDKRIVKKMHRILSREFYQDDDSLYYYKDKAVIHEKKRKHGFYGNKYVLISGKVFSGGALFSALVRDKSDAIFVGEETGGGYYRHTGSIPLEYRLPNSGVVVSFSIVVAEQDVNQKLFKDGHGTSPQFEVYPTIEQYTEGQDTVLEFVLKKQ